MERDTVVAPPKDWIQSGSDDELAYWAETWERCLEGTALATDQRKNIETILEMIATEQLKRRARQIKEVFGE